MHGNHFVGIGACHEQKVSKMPSCLESSSSSYSLAFAVAASGLPTKGGSLSNGDHNHHHHCCERLTVGRVFARLEMVIVGGNRRSIVLLQRNHCWAVAELLERSRSRSLSSADLFLIF